MQVDNGSNAAYYDRVAYPLARSRPLGMEASPMTQVTMAHQKILIRCFVLSILVLIVADVWPAQSWNVRIKKPIAQALDWMGLRQGSWAMFTPDPVLNNRWISAEMKTRDGQTLNWDSPLWSRASGWDKFVQFRHINYYKPHLSQLVPAAQPKTLSTT